MLPLLYEVEHFLQLGGWDGHGHVNGVELDAQPCHGGGGRGGFGLVLFETQFFETLLQPTEAVAGRGYILGDAPDVVNIVEDVMTLLV